VTDFTSSAGIWSVNSDQVSTAETEYVLSDLSERAEDVHGTDEDGTQGDGELPVEPSANDLIHKHCISDR
jgi:hypothetical protein